MLIMMSEKYDGFCRALIKWAKKGPDKMILGSKGASADEEGSADPF